ncbi:DNA-3-methyladenine glycosylase I [Algimonas porphyrae]|uniref:DNA-3-methyladenine glycosylase I n=1 Tax=Algimonas porphyrae TaxID=1128113 RepID=A0ABQ5V1Y1_9PROT|nr:DNA-3-methyladenine glycosylase I [Algimonas porphyrae]GLQ20972.1 DNA-3-methyladenine glycosylase I [Algimonas porphyrae]
MTEFPDHDPDLRRCGWVPKDDALYCHYHDTEWGRPIRDSKALFSKLIQDGQQAGLAWITILRKRAHMLKVYDGFDPDIVAFYTDQDRARLLDDPGIIRSRSKIDATIGNAKVYLAMRDGGIHFSDYLWDFVGGKPIVNHWESFSDAPVKSPESEALSKDLKARGFKFVGPVIVYAFMQAVGMINDHELGCCAREASLKMRYL